MRPDPRNFWVGVWRLTIRRHFTREHLLALAGMIAVLALILFAFLRGKDGAERYLSFAAAFYFTFLVPLLAFVAGGGAWRDELKPETADYVFTRAAPKGLYLLLRYGAHVLCSQIDFAAAFAVVAALGFAWRVPGLGGALPATFAAQALSVAAFAAFGFFCATISSRWVIVGLVYGAAIEVGIGDVPLPINRLAMTHQAKAILHLIARAAVPGAAVPPARPLVAGALLAFFAVAWAAAAAALFTRVELSGSKVSDG